MKTQANDEKLIYICPYCGNVEKLKIKLSRVSKNAKNGKDVFCNKCDAVVTGSILQI